MVRTLPFINRFSSRFRVQCWGIVGVVEHLCNSNRYRRICEMDRQVSKFIKKDIGGLV